MQVPVGHVHLVAGVGEDGQVLFMKRARLPSGKLAHWQLCHSHHQFGASRALLLGMLVLENTWEIFTGHRPHIVAFPLP